VTMNTSIKIGIERVSRMKRMSEDVRRGWEIRGGGM